jgi:group I intron endonuclease
MKSIPRMGIYAIEGPNSCIYIGSATNIQGRWRGHRYDLRKGKHHSRHLQRAWNKYGEGSFVFRVIEGVESVSLLLIAEQKWLNYIFETFPSTNIYNNVRTAGHTIGHKFSDETRRKLAEAHKGVLRGPQSPEHRSRLSMAHKGRHHTPEQRNQNAIAQNHGKRYTIISPDGAIFTDIINMSDFARQHGLRSNLLRMVLRGEREHTEGWTGWIDGQEPLTKPAFPKYTFVSPDGEIHANIIYPGRFARQHNLTISAVWRVLRGENKQHKGWTGFVQEI